MRFPKRVRNASLGLPAAKMANALFRPILGDVLAPRVLATVGKATFAKRRVAAHTVAEAASDPQAPMTVAE